MLLVVLAAAPSASAKGPSHAEISGPGLAHPIVFKGYGEPGVNCAFGRLVDGLGFFQAAFGQQPSPMLSARPRETLGPRYAVRYRVPTGSRPATITQTLYPYASAGAVVYTPPGQPLFGTTTPGGWFRALPGVKPLLVRRGLPATPTARTDSSGTSWLIRAGVAVFAVLAAVAGGSRLRRRPAPTPA